MLTCALHQPIADVNTVEVLYPQVGFEPGNGILSNSDLQDPPVAGQFATPDAEPEVSTDGEGDLSYFRPWRGGSDDNAADEFSTSSAVSIEVFEDGTPLTVKASEEITSGLTVSFSASVTGSQGSIPDSQLNWSWNFGDGHGSSTQSNPTYTYTSAGNYPAIVTVTDPSTGQAGSGNDPVDFPSPSGPGTTPQQGSGSTTPTNGAPTGSQTTAGTRPSGPRGTRKPTVTTTSPATHHHGKHAVTSGHKHKRKATHHKKSTPTPTPTGAGSGGSGGSSTGSPNDANDKALASKHSAGRSTSPTNPTAHPKNPIAPATGRLISDVITLPANESPLVHAVSAPVGSGPVIRRAIRASSDLSGVLAAAATVLLLFTLGVGRELRWRHDWRALRLGS